MFTTHKYGFWITIPEGSGFTRKSVEELVFPNLEKLGALQTGVRGRYQEVKGLGSKKVWGVPVPESQLSFGVAVEIGGKNVSEVSWKADIAFGVITDHHGLKAVRTDVIHEGNNLLFVKRSLDDETELGVEIHQGDKTRRK